ncbi:MAG: 3-phosphoshikimate 1-carboxyvinyltransferase [Agathobacter sp.]|nr:3-phosphoshikimate 1-carboxyvinyltransferase [Agathobacter sp.]
MSISDIYEVKRIEKPHDIVTSVPGSKSITNRALLIAALAEGTSVLHGVLFSDDSRYFMQALDDLGFPIHIDLDNETVTIEGFGGEIPREEAEIYVGSAGTAARFLTALLGLSKGRYRITASEQMKKRPMKELLVALEEMGSEIIYEEEEYCFPFTIGNFECKKSKVTIDVEKSSQFLSALLISSVLLPQNFMIKMTGNHGMAYVNMTMRMMTQFGVGVERTITGAYRRKHDNTYEAREYVIEPDVSAACYFYALSPLLRVKVQVKNVRMDCLQGDVKFLKVLVRMGCKVENDEDGVVMFPPKDKFLGGSFDLSSFSDQTLTLAAIAPFASSKVCIMNVGHIRYQECDRIQAIVKNLSKMGVAAIEQKDNVFILPGKPQGCVVETFEDHRVAMAFSLVGTVVDGIQIENPSCTKKTFENYFEVLEESVY